MANADENVIEEMPYYEESTQEPEPEREVVQGIVDLTPSEKAAQAYLAKHGVELSQKELDKATHDLDTKSKLIHAIQSKMANMSKSEKIKYLFKALRATGNAINTFGKGSYQTVELLTIVIGSPVAIAGAISLYLVVVVLNEICFGLFGKPLIREQYNYNGGKRTRNMKLKKSATMKVKVKKSATRKAKSANKQPKRSRCTKKCKKM